jgi:hypothetical protein
MLGNRRGIMRKIFKQLYKDFYPMRATKLSFLIKITALFYLLAFWTAPEVGAIDVYSFVVQFKNGMTVDRISSQSPENYMNYFQGYVEKVELLRKKHYSVNQFIEDFGEEHFQLLLRGLFFVKSNGEGLVKSEEEQIMFERMTNGKGPDPGALSKRVSY